MVTLCKSYGSVGDKILVVKNNVASALEVFDSFGSCLLNLLQFGYKRRGIYDWFVFCQNLSLQPRF